MTALNKYPWLISFLVLLISLKFVIVPVLQWQNDAIQSLAQENRRWDRAQRAINNIDSNKQHLALLEKQYNQLNALFFAHSEEASFKLEQQQWLEKLTAKHNFDINNIGWTFSAKALKSPLIKHTLNFSFSGQTYDLPALHMAIESQTQWLDIIDFSFAISGQRGESLGSVRGDFTLQFYQLPNKDTQQGVNNDN